MIPFAALALGLSLLLPLALAALAPLPGIRARSLKFLPLAPLPALATALAAPEGTVLVVPDALFGLRLELDRSSALFLGFAAFLWTAAGVFALRYMRGKGGQARFSSFWCLTLAGNLGVFLAGDVATFYAAFACVSLAAYPLVVHSGTDKARRAGLVYIVLAMAGETCLLLGFMLGASGAETLAIADIREAVATAPARDAAIALLVAGFGIKAGLVPLHVWLPLAHPAAPTPASAVLSGAIVKAGIFGLMQFLPAGHALADWQALLTKAGIATAWFGILVGLTQANAKTILAYSTVSQMGIVIAVTAAVLGGTGTIPETALAAAGLYALHHGLAKGALFMGFGVVEAGGRKARLLLVALLALPALSIAGFPLTGGALAKLAIKPPLGGGAVEWLVTLSAVGTSLVMLRFLTAALRMEGEDRRSGPPLLLLLPWLATIAAALALPWVLFPETTGEAADYALAPSNLRDALWPVLAAVILAGLALRIGLRGPAVPEGDLLSPVAALGWRLRSMTAGLAPRPYSFAAARRLPSARPLARLESLLANWSVGGTLVLVLALLAALSTTVAASG